MSPERWMSPLSARKIVVLPAPFGEPRKEAEHAIKIGAEVLPIGAHIGAKAEILLDGEIDKGAAPVRHVRDSKARDVLRRQRADRAAAKPDVAGARDESAERPQDRRLAGAIGAEHRGHAAVLDLEIDAMQRARRTVPGLETLRFQDRGAQFALPR